MIARSWGQASATVAEAEGLKVCAKSDIKPRAGGAVVGGCLLDYRLDEESRTVVGLVLASRNDSTGVDDAR